MCIYTNIFSEHLRESLAHDSIECTVEDSFACGTNDAGKLVHSILEALNVVYKGKIWSAQPRNPRIIVESNVITQMNGTHMYTPK
jgi:hypothetical protein